MRRPAAKNLKARSFRLRVIHAGVVSYSTAWHRLKAGWDEEDAIFVPVNGRQKTYGLKEFWRATTNPAVNYATAFYRVSRLGWSWLDAVSIPATSLLSALAAEAGLAVSTVTSRLSRGRPLKQALSPELRVHIGSVPDRWRRSGSDVPLTAVLHRIRKGESFEQAIAGSRRIYESPRYHTKARWARSGTLLSYELVRGRLKTGWEFDRAISEPKRGERA